MIPILTYITTRPDPDLGIPPRPPLTAQPALPQALHPIKSTSLCASYIYISALSNPIITNIGITSPQPANTRTRVHSVLAGLPDRSVASFLPYQAKQTPNSILDLNSNQRVLSLFCLQIFQTFSQSADISSLSGL